jgi:hypothetical protein
MLQARLELPKRQRSYLAIKDARREALRVRCQAFKEQMRAGLQTTFMSLSEKEMEELELVPTTPPGPFYKKTVIQVPQVRLTRNSKQCEHEVMDQERSEHPRCCIC